MTFIKIFRTSFLYRCYSITQSCLTLCNPINCSMPGFPSLSLSLLKLMSIESMMPSNHLIVYHPLLLLLSVFPSIRVFSSESALHIRWPNYWSISISPSKEYSGLISFKISSLTRWTWVWVNSESWWWTGRPGVLRFMGLQRVGHDWATELNWTELKISLVERKMFSASSSSQEETWWYLLGRGALKVMFILINLLLFCVGSKKLENFFEFF